MSPLSPQSSTTTPPLRVRAEMGDERRTFTFEKGFRIGRTDDCEVCIKNEHVSRRHVEVVVDNGSWLVRDLNSANGIFVNSERVTSVPVYTAVKIRLGIYGPFVEFEVAPQPVVARPPVQPLQNLQPLTPDPPRMQPAGTGPVQKAGNYYIGDPNDQSIGEHTRIIRRAVAEVQTKQKRRYGGVIAALVLCAIGVGAYAFYLQQEAKKNRANAETNFYAMKTLEVQIADFERMFSQSGNAQAAEKISQMRTQRQIMDDAYQRTLVSLKVYDQKMTDEQKLVLQVARIFGECELDMPKDFYAEVSKYIGYWKATPKFRRAVRRAQEKGYVEPIARQFISQGLPPQFFYLAMQESEFDEYAVGPNTYMGYAKGMWQFIPKTAMEYGLRVGPLVNMPESDVADDRHHWDRATKAAAQYIKFLYSTDAQASGLLVMGCYNWGEKSVLKLVQSMPKNPRERNFWKLLTLHREKIPDQTYKYVFAITAAAVIGQNPRAFGFDFDNPLQGIRP